MTKQKKAEVKAAVEAERAENVGATNIDKVAQNIVMVRVVRHNWGGLRSATDLADEAAKRHKAGADAVRAMRQYLPDALRRRINNAINAITRYLDGTPGRPGAVVPWEVGGWRALLAANVPKFKMDLQKLITEVTTVRDDFKRNYDKYKAESKARMKDLWRDEEFPKVSMLEDLYGVDVQYRAVMAPRNVAIEGLDEETRNEIRKQTEQQIMTSLKGATQTVVNKLSEILEGLVERLSREDQKSISYGAILKAAPKMHESLSRLNIAQDAELQKTIDKVREVMMKVDAKTTRASADQRKEIAGAATTIRDALKSFGM